MSEYRVTSNSFNNAFNSQFQLLNNKQYELINRATTGQKIATASDDPAAMGRVLEMEQEKREASQYNRNMGKAKELSDVGYSRIKELQSLLTRAQEIAALTNSDLSPENFGPYEKELEGMVEQAVSVLNGKYLGESVFAGDMTDTDPINVTRDANNKITGLTYQGSTNPPSGFYISEGVQMSPRTDASTNQALMGVVTNIMGLRDALGTQDSAQVRALEPSLRTNEDTVISELGDISANLMRIDFSKNENRSRFSELDSRISQEADADLADTVMKLSQVQTALQAALQGGARIMSQSLLNYL